LDTTTQLTLFHDNSKEDRSGTILLPVTKLDPKAECSTVLPLPIGAEMCAHNMEVIVNERLSTPHESRLVVVLECKKCGVIDKTITVTSPPPPAPPPPKPPEPRSECRHQWVKEKSVTLESAFEQMEEILKQGATKPKKTSDARKKIVDEEEEANPFDPTSAPAWMFAKKFLRERVCSKCGEVDRVVVSNFEVENDLDERMDEEKEGRV
jgi:RNase P subunit RPR2